MKFIINSSGITLFHNGSPITVAKGSSKYARIMDVFDLPESERDEAVNAVLSAQPKYQESLQKEGFEIVGDHVFMDGEKLAQPLAQKILSLQREELPFDLFLNFFRNLQQNPSASSIQQLYDFLAYKELPITEDGCFLAYRGLNADFWSISGNKNTRVLSGKVNHAGQIFNGVGEYIAVERNQVDDNRSLGCSYGLHAGSFDYAKGWGQGKMVVVKINPKDVVSVPEDCGYQKLRCCAYEVIAEISIEIHEPATDSNGQEFQDTYAKSMEEFVGRLSVYLSNRSAQGDEMVSVQKVRNAFSPDYPSKERVLSAVDSLGMVWTQIDGKEMILV